MGMFSDYDNLDQNYIPTNIKPPKPNDGLQLQSCRPSMPYEEYNAQGELIGYWWYCGNTVTFEFNITGEMTVESDSIIYTHTTEAPTSSTIGKPNQMAYNVIDLKAWKCNVQVDNTYTWTPQPWDPEGAEGQRNVYIDVSDFVKDKECIVKLYNFRREIIDKKTLPGSTTIIYEIDKEMASKLTRGNYFISLEIFDDNLNSTLFYQLKNSLTIK